MGDIIPQSRVEEILLNQDVTPQSRVEALLKELVMHATDREVLQELVDDAIADVVDSAPAQFDTLREIATWIETHSLEYNQIVRMMTGKQDLLTFDGTPRVDSGNPVTSAGILAALNTKQPLLPAITAADAGKVLAVSANGTWTVVSLSDISNT